MPENNQLLIQLDLKVPMADGVNLYAVLFRPIDGDRFPVLLLRRLRMWRQAFRLTEDA